VSLPLTPESVVWLPKSDRFEAFGKWARYQPEHSRNGSDRYAIRLGSTTLYSADTADLFLQFEDWVRKERKRARRR
jgi:hypothetical protein